MSGEMKQEMRRRKKGEQSIGWELAKECKALKQKDTLGEEETQLLSGD